jgi:hypothetical protein
LLRAIAPEPPPCQRNRHNRRDSTLGNGTDAGPGAPGLFLANRSLAAGKVRRVFLREHSWVL